MKTSPILPAAILAVLVLLSACVSFGAGLVLEPVGPPALPSVATASVGRLVIFSAFSPNAPRAGDWDYRERYTDYDISTLDGHLLRSVANDAGLTYAAPAEVELPPGSYRVSARANRYGRVLVPVVIAAGRTTTVHLEGGNATEGGTEIAASAVRLPDGQIVGWRAP
jgi:hypothetical protein